MDQHPRNQNQPIRKVQQDFNQFLQRQKAKRPPGYSPLDNLIKKRQQNKRREQEQIQKAKKQFNRQQQNKKPFTNEQTFLKSKISQRAQKASQGHLNLIQQISKRSQPSQKIGQKTIFINQQKKVFTQRNQDHSKFNNQNNPIFNNIARPSNNIFGSIINQVNPTVIKQPKTLQPNTNNSTTNNTPLFNNPFFKPTQIQQPLISNNIFSNQPDSDQQKVQAPKLNIFQNKSTIPQNKPTISQNKPSLFSNPFTNTTNNQNNTNFGSKTPLFSFSNSHSNQVLPTKSTKSLKPVQTGLLFSAKPINLFSTNNNNFLPSNNLFSRDNNQEKNSNINIIHSNSNQIQNQSITNPQNTQNKNNLIQQKQKQRTLQIQIQKPTTKVNIFAEGLFQNVKQSKEKPTIIFNNNVNVIKPTNPLNAQIQTKKQPVKLLFNNNSGTVQNIKPSIYIFTGQSIITNQQKYQPIQVQVQQSPVKKSLFNTQEKNQEIKPANYLINSESLFSSNANNNQNKQLLKSQIKQQKQMAKIPLFSNPLSNTSSFTTPTFFNTNSNSLTGGLFSSNSLKPQLLSVNENQSIQSGLFSSSKKNQNKVQPPLPQIQPNSINLFGNNKPANNQQKVKSNTNTNIGLFANNNSKNNQQTPFFNQTSSQKSNLLNLNAQKKRTNSLFATSSTTNNIFSKPTQNKQSQPQEQNIFKKAITQNSQSNSSNNLFAKVYSQQPQSGNIFKNSLNTGQNLFGNTRSSLFGNNSSQNMFATTKPAVNFDQDEENEDDQQGDEQIQNSEPQVVEGEMKFNYDQPQIVFPRSEVIKFKDPYKAQSNLLQNVKISIQRFPNSQQSYMIVRLPNRRPIFIGFFVKQSQVNVMKKRQSVSIQRMLQNKDGNIIQVRGLRILFKNEDDAKKFVLEANKIISNKKIQNK